MTPESLPDSKPSGDARHLIDWLLGKPQEEQETACATLLRDLLDAASQPRHLSGKSCNKLCHYVELCRRAKAPTLTKCIYSEETAQALFSFFIEWSETNQHRSMRQVLELVVSLIIDNPNRDEGDRIRRAATDRLVSIVAHQSAQPLVKPAFKAFEYFLSKRVVTGKQVVTLYAELERLPRELDAWRQFTANIFDWMCFSHIATGAGRFLTVLFQDMDDNFGSETEVVQIWQSWILEGLRRQPDSLENIKNYLLSTMFRTDRSRSILLLQSLVEGVTLTESKDGLDVHSCLLLAALEAGKKLSLVEETNYIQSQTTAKKNREFILLPEIAIGNLLSHPDTSVRSTAFSVLVASSSPLRPFPPAVLSILKQHLAALHADTDAKFRNDTLSTTRHMIERVRGSLSFLGREITAAATKQLVEAQAKLKVLIDAHESFLLWYVDFLADELVPTASYQRHITSLKCLLILLRSGILPKYSRFGSQSLADVSVAWPFSVDIFGSALPRLLLDLILDPFEDVRGQAQTVLKYAPVQYWGALADRACDASSLEVLTAFIGRANNLASLTGRADLADGVARSYELLYSCLDDESAQKSVIVDLVQGLENKISIAEENLGKAIIAAPVHSQFAALSMVWQCVYGARSAQPTSAASRPAQPGPEVDMAFWNQVQRRMIACYKRIWHAVQDVLCNDSPEGHFPQDLDEQEVIDTKDVLSYSFRAVHESSHLMGVMVSKAVIQTPDGSPFLPFELFEEIGNLSFEQLSLLRHRGALSTVALTFARCCQSTQQLPPSVGPVKDEILQKWYKGTITCIQEQASTTRRSAGIPAMMTGILSSNAPSPSFNEVMDRLKMLSRKPAQLTQIDETVLPQVHAMNCLKEIFKSSLLGKRAEAHIADGLQLAADSLQAEIWAIRNCGLLLLRSLIDCLFGTTESKLAMEAGWDGKSIRLSYDKYSSLPSLLLELLRKDTEPQTKLFSHGVDAMESVFPALDIIRRAGPPNRQSAEIYLSVEMHLRSKVWDVRDIAARTVCTLILNENWMGAIAALFHDCTTANHLHGVLLVAKSIQEKMVELNVGLLLDGLPAFVTQLKDVYDSHSQLLQSPDLLGAYYEVVNALMKTLLTMSRMPSRLSISDQIQQALSLVQTDHNHQLMALLSSRSSESNALKFGSSALLRKAAALTPVYGAGLLGTPKELADLLLLAGNADLDTGCAIAESIPEVWDLEITAPAVLQDLATIHIAAFEGTTNPSFRAIVLSNLAQILEVLSGCNADFGAELDRGIVGLGAALVLHLDSPELSNAKLRVSGSILQREFARHEQHLDSRLHAWGCMISASSTAENDFDTRYAAASSLRAFYGSISQVDQPCLVSSLLALYDILNDDDDEIRDLGAKTVSAVIGKSSIPLTAAAEFSGWLVETFPSSELLWTAIVARITSAGQPGLFDLAGVLPVTEQLAAAMEVDDSLFVEEEQNLFIDEIREVNVWCHLLRKGMGPETVVRQLCAWVSGGLTEITRLAATVDGPVGWTSKPAVFAISMTVIVTAKALGAWGRVHDESGALYEIASVQRAVLELERVGRENHLHELFLAKLAGQKHVGIVQRSKQTQ